ncbi:YkgJ family cysteine cluster protein [Roseospira goensis]|uniref:Fe-S-cluster containining protein n=1 Tax=Roseospira goensis TaxID=391922 RepID=A0A7W6RXP1_9PROT|nr:YkgJ family cysteine cluster protein [Roseospira goensis]MBB4284635.1 Fe-S-cluster containining protein [Roseospira goensis]
MTIQDRTPLERQIVEAVHDAAAESLASRPTPAGLATLLEQLWDIAEDLARRNQEAAPPPQPIACRAGCSICCHARWILVTAPEVLVLADAVRARPDAGDVRTRADAAALAPAIEVTRPPCALLDGAGLCSVYAVRPLKCRGHTSMDLAACEATLATDPTGSVPVYYPRQAIYNAMQAGLLAGAVTARYRQERLELRGALARALAIPDATARWLAGTDVFHGIRMP